MGSIIEFVMNILLLVVVILLDFSYVRTFAHLNIPGY